PNTEGDDVDSITYNGASKVDIHVADLCINNNGETLFTYNPFKINTETLNLYPLRLIINGESCPYTPTANNIIYNFDELFLDELRSNVVLFSGVAEFEEMPGGQVGFMLKGTSAKGVQIGSTTSPSAPMNPLRITLNCVVTGVTVSPCIRDTVEDTMYTTSILRASISEEDNKTILVDSVRPTDSMEDGAMQLNKQTLGTEIKKFNIIITGHKE
ncbi:MAG: hypothetical protein K2G70_00140, partial [Turicibacter sp.]|nr:hypothetical protein [Turicibacter sp.]